VDSHQGPDASTKESRRTDSANKSYFLLLPVCCGMDGRGNRDTFEVLKILVCASHGWNNDAQHGEQDATLRLEVPISFFCARKFWIEYLCTFVQPTDSPQCFPDFNNRDVTGRVDTGIPKEGEHHGP
jgi:hypothetical protein